MLQTGFFRFHLRQEVQVDILPGSDLYPKVPIFILPNNQPLSPDPKVVPRDSTLRPCKLKVHLRLPGISVPATPKRFVHLHLRIPRIPVGLSTLDISGFCVLSIAGTEVLLMFATLLPFVLLGQRTQGILPPGFISTPLRA